MNTASTTRIAFAAALLTASVTLLTSTVATADGIKRTASGKPDLSGTYDVSTLTPFQRPEEFGDNRYLTPDAAAAIVEENRQRV
ncbi:MAG: hypothetical protein V2I41_10715, partial [Pseudomonadales bacterium]|nr:hypothetical protein [Pseudomonadales bacterium]